MVSGLVHSSRNLRPIEGFLLCLVRLRLCLQVTDFAFRFSVSSTTMLEFSLHGLTFFTWNLKP